MAENKKYIDKVQILTCSYVSLDYEAAPLNRRLGALVVDFLLLSAICGAIFEFGTFWWSYILSSLFLTLNLFLEYWGNGRTLGKRVMKIKTISLDGTAPSFSQCFLRSVLFPIDCLVGVFFVKVLNARLGDLASGCRVVLCENSSNTKVSLSDDFFYAQAGYVPSFKSIAAMSPIEANAVRRVLYDPDYFVYLEQVDSLVRTKFHLLHIESDANTLLKQVLQDFNYYSNAK